MEQNFLPWFQLVVGVIGSYLLSYCLGSQIWGHILDAVWTATNPIVAVHGRKSIPGPRFSLPLGQGTEKVLAAREKSLEWRETYGSIYRIWNGCWPEVVLTEPKDVELYYSGKAEHGKTAAYTMGSVFARTMANAVGLINGDAWKDLRRYLDQFFDHKAASKLTPFICQRAEEYAKSLPETRLSSESTGGVEEKLNDDRIVINVVQSVQPYAFFVTSEIFYGVLSQAERDELWEIAEEFIVIAGYILREGMNRTRFTKWLYSLAAWRSLWKFERKWKIFNRNMATARQKESHLPIVKLYDDLHKGKITEQAILETLTESMFGNLDVTTYVIAACVLLLTDNPEVLKRVLTEIEAAKDDLEIYIERQDTLLHWSFLEALRLEPIPAFSFPECASEDKVLGGYLVPRGTSITIDANALNIFNPFWGPDSREYRPERFASIKPTQLRYNLSTFGYGSRKCLGKHFGGKIVRAFLSHMLLRYNLVLETGSKLSDHDFKLHAQAFIPLFDCKVELLPREKHA